MPDNDTQPVPGTGDETEPVPPAGDETGAVSATIGVDAAPDTAGDVEAAAGADVAPVPPAEGAGSVEERAERRRAAERAAVIPPTTVRVEPVDVHPPTSLERTSYSIVRGLFLGVAKVWFRLEIRGAENVPASGPFVLAPVHRSNLDFILVATVRRPRMRYMGKASIWKWSPLGKFVSMLGAFPVHRGTADRESLRTCMRVIENGEPLVMFPEGTRKSGATVDDLFDGPAYVAAKAGVPLVPVGIGGSDRALPVGARYIRPRKIVIVVGEPIVPPQGDGSGRVPRRVIRQLTEQLHADVQRLYDEARADAEPS